MTCGGIPIMNKRQSMLVSSRHASCIELCLPHQELRHINGNEFMVDLVEQDEAS